MTGQVILYGGKLSLYTARVRSYLRHQRIAFTERASGSDRAFKVIYPAIGRRIIPVVELADGTLLQDGSLIIDHFETSGLRRFPVYPDDPALNVVARLFDLFGNEGLVRPAMHYRWNLPEQTPFVRHIFREALPLGKNEAENDADFEKLSGFLRKYTAMIGTTAENAAMIEAAYLDFLDRLNAHFAVMPYLLGGGPTIADYALFGPLFAHLGRDRLPLALMQECAPYVFDWTERMNAFEDIEDAVSVAWGGGMVDLEDPPATLVSLLNYVAEEYSTEYAAHHAFCDQWLGKKPNEVIEGHRVIGMTQIELRGAKIPVPVKAYRHFLSQRMTDAFDDAPRTAQGTVRALFTRCGLEPFLDRRLPRRVGWRNYLEVWEPFEAAPDQKRA
ncbi:glutathione binding-like protein [Planktomarina temperata]|nr:glutathione binding-like protein [Planktomarina temperata]